MRKFRITNVYFMSFILCLLLGMLSFLPFMLNEAGMFTLGTDYDAAQIPLYDYLRRAIYAGESYWNWSLDLGTDFWTGESFLILGSPFFWLTMLFPKVQYIHLGGIMFILKYGLAGLTASLYIKRFVKNDKFALAGSILYAFSGFQAVNLMMGAFHDMVAIFPLVLWGLEKLLIDKKRGWFALFIGLSALTNYYLFIGQVIFVVIYFLFRYFWGHTKDWKSLLSCLAEGLLGLGLSAVLFIPSALAIMSNPRSGNHLSVSQWFLPDR